MNRRHGSAGHSVLTLLNDGVPRTRAKIVEELGSRHKPGAIDMALTDGVKNAELLRQKTDGKYVYSCPRMTV